jgi:hypothetical protein
MGDTDPGFRARTRRNHRSAGNLAAVGAKLCCATEKQLEAHYQHLMQGWGGDPAKKDVNKMTFEVGMYMKTNKTKTKCLIESRTFTTKFRTFTSN